MRTYSKKATQLCFCDYFEHPNSKCHCATDQVARYHGKISGPLLDRIDVQIEVPAVPQQKLMKQQLPSEKIDIIRQRVEKSHPPQLDRQGKTNSHLSVKEISVFSWINTMIQNTKS